MGLSGEGPGGGTPALAPGPHRVLAFYGVAPGDQTSGVPSLSTGGLISVNSPYAAWLGSLPWTYFLTITFREPVPAYRQETAVHAVGNTLVKLAGEDHELLFLASEPHLSKNTHLHGLLKIGLHGSVPYGVMGTIIWQRLFDLYGRSKVEQPRGQVAVGNYVAKYCTKTLGYYELW